MKKEQISFSEFVGVGKPCATVIRNNTECYWVPASNDAIYECLLQKKVESSLEWNFQKELNIAIKNYNGEGFFVPIYAAASSPKGKLVTSPEYKPEFGRSLQMWEKYANKFGYEIGEYSQFVLWLGAMVSNFMGTGNMSFSQAAWKLYQKAEKIEDEVHTCKLMHLYAHYGIEYAVVTGIDVDNFAHGHNILYHRQVLDSTVIGASPFLIIPKK